MLTPPQIGARLTAERRNLQLAPDRIEELARLRPGRFQEMEGGINLTMGELWRVAAALGVDGESLLQPAPPEPDRSTARFLSAGEEIKGPDLRLLRVAAEAGRIGGWLRDQLGITDDLPGTPTPLADPHPGQEGYRLGAEARTLLRAGTKPIPSVAGLLEERGVHIGAADFATPGVIAASLREPGAVPVILLNRKSDRAQKARSRRSVLAHELCHLLHDLEPARRLTSVTRSPRPGEREEAQEQRANAFAPAFLAPREELPAALSDAWLTRSLIDTWGLSAEAAAWYTVNLRSLPAEVADRLRKLPAKTYLSETEMPASLTGGYIGKLAELAQHQAIISEARLSEIRRMA